MFKRLAALLNLMTGTYTYTTHLDIYTLYYLGNPRASSSTCVKHLHQLLYLALV